MNQRFMQAAIEQARRAALAGEVPVGAVIVKDNQIIAVAHNRCEELHDPTAHAEILAIQSACQTLHNFRLTGASLYVTLEPCPMCAGAAINARLTEIVFGASDPVKGALGSTCNLYSYEFPNRPQVFGGIEERACAALLREFFEQKRTQRVKFQQLIN